MAAIGFSLLVLALRFVVMPNIENYREQIVGQVAQASGMAVSATALRGGWSGFRPTVMLADVAFRDPAARDPAFRLSRLDVSFSWWTLFTGQIHFHALRLSNPELTLSRASDGLIYFAGKPLNKPDANQKEGALLPWLLEQPGVEIRDATVTWSDALNPGPPLRFTDVQLRVEKQGKRHRIGFFSKPPAALATSLEGSGDLVLQRIQQHWQVAGTIYAAAAQANLTELRHHLTVPDLLRAGTGNIRAWVDIDSQAIANPVRTITADLNVVQATAQLANDLAPLHIAKLAGRIEYQAREGGFLLASKQLEFRTRDGVAQGPADFSITLLNQASPQQARGEMAANGIDLKVIAALLEYFPVGKEVRQVVARFSPRGMVVRTQVAWNGTIDKPTGYRIDGEVNGFGLNADGKIPGVSGFTGAVHGDEKGGKVHINSRQFALDMPHLFRAPLTFNTLDADATWKTTPQGFEIELSTVKFTEAEMTGELAGHYRRGGPTEKGPGSIDIKGKLFKVDATQVARYLPNGIAATRDYIEWAVQGGMVEEADFLLNGELYEFPFHMGNGGHFLIKGKMKDVAFRHTEKWPGYENINGDITFENTSFSAQINEAKIFGATIHDTVLGIEDMAIPNPLFKIKGEAHASAQDITRYLRESPLSEGIGAFTRFVQIEGSGQLALELDIPITQKEGFKVSGRYLLNRGSAKPAIGPLVTNINGSVQFTESSIKSMGLNGMAYGNPLTVAITGGGETGVVTTLTGRAELTQLQHVIPFPLPKQISGAMNIGGRITAKPGGTELQFESNLVGVTSTLPVPLAKQAETAQKLAVTFTHPGHSDERIRVTLGEQIDVRLRRRADTSGALSGLAGGLVSLGAPLAADAVIPEGIWLTGSMEQLDFDAWRATFEAAYPPISATSKAEVANRRNGDQPLLSFAGFDLKLGTLQAYGRPFSNIAIKGRQADNDWRLMLDGADASGDLLWHPGVDNTSAAIRARLNHLVLAEATAVNSDTSANGFADLPAMDIIAERFKFKGRELGKLELRAAPQERDWKIEKMIISNGHAVLDSDGIWQRDADNGRSRTTLNAKLEVKNLNALMAQFGYGDYLRRGAGGLEGVLSWPGHAYQFSSAVLSGHFKLQARNGQFAKIEPGAGKLLGLISLQSIPRRFTLDFRDLFSEGFAFDRIDGDIKIERGIMFTENFTINGPAAEVKMAGDVSLPAERQNLTLTVIPALGGGVALAAGVAAANPLLGAGVWLMQKILQNPIDRILSYQYTVTGTWDNPLVEKVNKNSIAQPALPDPPVATLPALPTSRKE